MAEQIFAAAHEFGHICNVAKKIWERLEYEGKPTEEDEEEITNRFAAELLMPEDAFRNAFTAHIGELNIRSGKVKADELAKVMVLLMNDFLVPYESVRKRFVETKIMNKETADFLLSIEGVMLNYVSVFLNDQNTYLGKGTGVKTIPGIRDLIKSAESNKVVDMYLVNKIKKDFDIYEPDTEEREIEIQIGDSIDD